MSMREQFEAWAYKRGYLFIDEQGGKEWDEDSNILWEAFLAGMEEAAQIAEKCPEAINFVGPSSIICPAVASAIRGRMK